MLLSARASGLVAITLLLFVNGTVTRTGYWTIHTSEIAGNAFSGFFMQGPPWHSKRDLWHWIRRWDWPISNSSLDISPR